MNTILLPESTFRLLEQKAQENDQTPDELADEMLRQQLEPAHAYIEMIHGFKGPRAMIRGSRIPVSTIVGYIHIGETAESIVTHILPSLTLAQVYDALSYYYDHKVEIDQELVENSEEHGRAYLRERLGEEGYQRLSGHRS